MQSNTKSILIIGLPGTGKTELAKELASRIHAIHWNADMVRKTINSDLGFSIEDRIEQARRMFWLASLTKIQGHNVIVDFICPNVDTRKAAKIREFDIVVWMNRTPSRDFTDTTAIWEEPIYYNIEIKDGLTVKEEADLIIKQFSLFDYRKPTTLLLGRYQPWHEGHSALMREAEKRTDQVLVGVRDTFQTSEKDPMEFNQVANNINKAEDAPFILNLPNITNIVYGRDVGYLIEKIDLGADIESISATEKRKEMGI